MTNQDLARRIAATIDSSTFDSTNPREEMANLILEDLMVAQFTPHSCGHLTAEILTGDLPGVTFDGRIDGHPLHAAIYSLCQEVEKLPPSPQATIAVSQAAALQDEVARMRAVAGTTARRLLANAAECFPESPDGKKHFARVLMEAEAGELNAEFNPVANTAQEA